MLMLEVLVSPSLSSLEAFALGVALGVALVAAARGAGDACGTEYAHLYIALHLDCGAPQVPPVPFGLTAQSRRARASRSISTPSPSADAAPEPPASIADERGE